MLEMPVEVDVLSPPAHLPAASCEHVHDDMVVGPHELLNGRKSGGPACRVKNDFATVEKLGNDPLELQRVLGIAKQSGRAGAVYAVFLDREMAARWTSGCDARLRVVLGGEVNARVRLSGIGKGGTAGLGRGQRSTGVLATDRAAGASRHSLEGIEAGQQIRPRHHPVIPQATLQSLVRRLTNAVPACPVRTHNNVPDCRNSRAILRGR